MNKNTMKDDDVHIKYICEKKMMNLMEHTFYFLRLQLHIHHHILEFFQIQKNKSLNKNFFFLIEAYFISE